MKAQLYADLPQDLQEADELLRRYGRWAMDRRTAQRCGSAERDYRPPQDDEDRQPREPIMPQPEVDRIRMALLKVATVNRTILLWLYVPDREHIKAKMRRCMVQPVTMRERHLAGVREFWGLWKSLDRPVQTSPCKPKTVLYDCAI